MRVPLQTEDDAPWKARYRAPQIAGAMRAEQAPGRGLVVTNRSGSFQLCSWDTASGQLRQITDYPTGKSFGYLAPDGRWVYYLHDDGGNEIGHFVRVPYAGGAPEDITPDLPPYASWSIAQNRAGTLLGFLTATGAGFTAYVVPVAADGALGGRRSIYRSARFAGGLALSYDGDLAVVRALEHSALQHYNLVVLDTATGARVGELWEGDGTSINTIGFSPRPADPRLLCTTDRTGVARPLLWNPRTGERVDFDLGDLPGEVFPLDWSDDGRRVLLSRYDRAVQRLYTYEIARERLTPLAHPGGTYGRGTTGCFFMPGGEVFALWQDSAHPSCVVALDAETGTRRRTVLAAGAVPAGRPWRSVRFASSGGQEIQAWLGVPEGAGPFPTILHTHGGPEMVTPEQFAPGSQSWLDHGFAFLSVNYRGSTTFGKAFQEAIWGHPGRWEVDDMAAGARWLVAQGIADPAQIFLTGASYGGYLTLLALGRRPDLWAGGIAVVAIADWTALYEDEAETLRAYQRALFGGTPEEQPAQYAESSPITYADRVRAPLLIQQGRNDTRCPDRQMEQYLATLRGLGKPVEIYWFAAGHGSLVTEEQIRQQEMALRFADAVLGRPAE